MARIRRRARGPRTGATRWRLVALITTVVLLAAAACSTPRSKKVNPPHSPAATQLRWLLASMAKLPLSGQETRAHVDPGYLATLRPATFNQLLQAGSRWLHAENGAALQSLRVDTNSLAIGIVAAIGNRPRGRVAVTVDSHGLIAGLDMGPTITGPVPSSWADVDATLRSITPQPHLLAADVSNGSCRPLHSIDADTPVPFGSVLKLYVLDALGRAVAAGKVRWDQPLTVTSRLKSLPSGVLQYEPDGTQITVREAAAKMISISDNTATDMLINLVGRTAVEASLVDAEMADPTADRPFLTTREAFTLAVERWPSLARRYLAANEAGRRALLTTVDRLPLPTVSAMRAMGKRGRTSPDWVSSTSDICRAYVSLLALNRQPGLSTVGQVLSLDDDALELDPSRWTTTWHKGGVGSTFTALSYLATTRTGRSYVVIVQAGNPSRPADPMAAAPTVLAAMKGAFSLTARD